MVGFRNINFKRHAYLKVSLFVLFTLFISTFLNQNKYYKQLEESRKFHYQDVIFIFEAMNKECLRNKSEDLCFDQFFHALNSYTNRGTITLYDRNHRIILHKKDESIYDHRTPVIVNHTFTEFKTLQPKLEISKLTSYPNLWLNSLNAMTFSSWNFAQDAISRLSGNPPVIKGMSWYEFARKVAWERFYPALPFVLALLGVALYGGWRRYQIEKINIGLIKQQQRLDQEKFELKISVQQLNNALEEKDHEALLLSSSIQDLNERIANSVDRKEIDILLSEKSSLENELKNNEREKFNLLETLAQKDQAQEELQNRVEQYEIKNGYTLVGEFVRYWTYFEKQLHRLCSTDIQEQLRNPKAKAVSVSVMIDDIYNQAIINQDLRDNLHLVRKFRNSIMHASNVDNQNNYQHIIHDLKNNIKILDQAIDKLQKQDIY
ncbi:hypothetical protein V3519_10865 [Acinetobacter variabilis]|uniref:coiled-coil domain-containing protein n=1 Tax=Acinetobacter variabilis TaxID=70346 RepID=UPI0030FA1B53